MSLRRDRTRAAAGPAPVRLARLRPADLDEVLEIEAELFGRERWTRQMFRGELDNGHYYLVARDSVAEPPGALVGYGGLALLPPDEAWINNLAVRRDAQRRGIGAALLAALLAEAERHRIDRVLLEVAADNLAAQKLYGRYGFEAIGLRRGYYQPSNTDALVLSRDRSQSGGSA